MKDNPITVMERDLRECASEKRRVGSGAAPRRNGATDLPFGKAGLRRLSGLADVPVAPADDDYGSWSPEGTARLQYIAPQVVACIQELSQANEELRENQTQLTKQASDLMQQLVRRNAQVRERIETIDTMRYVMAHVLREPVRSISSFAELLRADHAGDFDDEHKDQLERLAAAAGRLDHLIQDLLEFGGLNQTELMCENVSLEAALCKVLGERAGIIAMKGAEVEVQRDLPRVWGHLARLQEVLARLLDNALKFVATDRMPRIRIWLEPRETRLRLWIEDNGIGVPPDQQERIFGLFQRLDDTFPGTGAGLAIVRKAMEQMGGEAGTEPTTEGSRFWIDLRPAQGV